MKKLLEKRNKNLNNLRLLFLEQVHLSLDSGKVSENRFFSILQTLVGPYSKPLLSLIYFNCFIVYWIILNASKWIAFAMLLMVKNQEVMSLRFSSLILLLSAPQFSSLGVFEIGKLKGFSLFGWPQKSNPIWHPNPGVCFSKLLKTFWSRKAILCDTGRVLFSRFYGPRWSRGP